VPDKTQKKEEKRSLGFSWPLELLGKPAKKLRIFFID
jgi:hypothetical protein